MLRIYLLGNPHMEADGVALKLPLPSSLPLWAYLLLHQHTPVQRETLAQTLWPDEAEAAARARLSRQLYRLRADLPASVADNQASAEWLLTTASTVQWNPQADCWFDAAEFKRLSQSSATLSAAVALYTGDLLPGVYDDWLLYERERLRQRYIADLEQLVMHHRADGEYRQAIEYAQRLLATDPLHEATVRQLLAIHYQAGDRATALSVYERFSKLLADELDATPMPETVAVYEAIVRNLPLTPVSHAMAAPLAVEQRTLPPPLPFVGRATEMGRLEAAWQRAARGHGELALISGEAGIGKSRLCAELAARVEAQGARLLQGGTSAGEAAPYQAFVVALRAARPLLTPPGVDRDDLRAILPLLPELSARLGLTALPPIATERERERLYLGLANCLSALAQSRPLLLILEDLHWAGGATIQLLDFLSQQLAQHPMLIVATYREEEVGRGHPLRELRRRCEQEQRGLHLALGALSGEAVAQLVSGQGDIPAALGQQLYDESEGNPFFLNELVANLRESDTGEPQSGALPPGVRSVISERVSRLQPNTRLLAEIASVAGATFAIEVVREAAGWPERQALDALYQLLDRNLVRDMGSGGMDYAFGHHLIQETIYAGIDAGVRQRRHRRLGFVLEELYPTRRAELASELARHFDLGGDPDNAVLHYLTAARRALAVYADDEAFASATRAAALAADSPPRFDALALVENILHRRGERAAQSAALQQMRQIADETGNDDLSAEVLRRRIEMHSVLGEREQQGQLLGELLTIANGPRWRAVALKLRAEYLFELARYDEANDVLAEARQIYAELGDTDAVVECYCLLAECAVYQGRFGEVQRLLELAHEAASDDNPAQIARILKATARNVSRAGDTLGSYQVSLQQLEVCRRIHDYEGEADAHGLAARMATQLTLLDEALDHLAQATNIYAQLGKRSGEAGTLMRRALLLFRLAMYQECRAALREAEELYQQLGDIRGMVNSTICLAGVANDAHDFAVSHAVATRCLRWAREIGSQTFVADALLNMGVAELGLGNGEAAVENLQAGISLQREIHIEGKDEAYEELCYLAVACLLAGRLAQANAACVEAFSLYQAAPEQIPKPYYVYWALACLSRAQGDVQQSEDYLEVAYQHFTTWFAEREQKLAAYAAPGWREFYRGLSFHPDLLAAYERGEWPPYARLNRGRVLRDPVAIIPLDLSSQKVKGD